MANQTNETKKPRPGTKADLQAKLNSAHNELHHSLQLNAYLSRLTRAGLGRALGQSFDGDRDLYTTLGYKLDPEYSDYLNFYERDGIGTRFVNAVSDETWRKHPILTETKTEIPDENKPSKLQENFQKLVDKHKLWTEFNEIDRMLGFSRFALLYLGLPGNPEQEFTGNAKELAYVIAHDEGTAEVEETSIETDPESERFGLPNFYQIAIDDRGERRIQVHYSRVIHIKEGRQRVGGLGRVYGVPRMKKVLNYLQDLEKVVGGGSEAYWLLIYRGMLFMAQDGYAMPQKDSDDYKDMQDEIDEFMHGLRRYMRVQGMDVQDLKGSPVDSREQFDVLLACIAGSGNMPQRKLIGSAQGQLASAEEDEKDWNDYIDSRRVNQAEPNILRAFLDKGKKVGFIDLPDKYFVYWPPLVETSEKEKAEIAVKIATAINQASGGAPDTIIPAEEFASRLPDSWRYEWTPAQKRKQAEQEEKARGQDAGKNGSTPPSGGNGNSDSELIGNLDLKQLRRALESDSESVKFNNVWAGYQTMLPGDHWFPTPQGPVLIHNENEHSAMVALRIPPALRDELQKQYPFMDDETRDNLHITLAFLGDSRTIDMEKTANAVISFSDIAMPIKTKLQGIARFVSGGEKDAIVATIDSPEFPEFRQMLCAQLDAFGIPYHKEHGFIPHMTLAYIPKDDPMPIDTIEPMEMNFSEVFLVDGNVWNGVALGKQGAPAEKDNEL